VLVGNLIGPWKGVYTVEGFDECELEVQMKGMVFFDGDGLEVPDFEWTLEGAEVNSEAADTLADHWNLEELFLEDVWANLYTMDSIKVGGTYILQRPSPTLKLPARVEVIEVCKLRNEIRWQVVCKSRVFTMPGESQYHLMPTCDFYDPSWKDQENDGPRYVLEPVPSE